MAAVALDQHGEQHPGEGERFLEKTKDRDRQLKIFLHESDPG